MLTTEMFGAKEHTDERAVRRTRRIARYGYSLLGLCALGFIVIKYLLGFVLPPAMAAPIRDVPNWLFILVFILLEIPFSVIWFRTMMRLQRHEFSFCPTCGYCLAHKSEKGVCPECGKPYVLSEVRDRWFWALMGRNKETTFEAPDTFVDADFERRKVTRSGS
jgi:ribosomal protein S27AE